MAYPAAEEPYSFGCPYCKRELRIAFQGQEACPHCGAELDLFSTAVEANQFAEEQKSLGETAFWRKVEEQPYWIVAHKGTPTNMRQWPDGR